MKLFIRNGIVVTTIATAIIGCSAPQVGKQAVKEEANSKQMRYAKEYAKSAIKQANQNIKYGCNYEGKRWSTDSNDHYEWALKVAPQAMASEESKREKALSDCLRK